MLRSEWYNLADLGHSPRPEAEGERREEKHDFVYGMISNAVPKPYLPNWLVTPNRWPLPSRITP
jgi:hypothetical protein